MTDQNDPLTAAVNARVANITALLKRMAATSNAMRAAGASELDITKWASGELQAAGLLTAEQAARAVARLQQEQGDDD